MADTVDALLGPNENEASGPAVIAPIEPTVTIEKDEQSQILLVNNTSGAEYEAYLLAPTKVMRTLWDEGYLHGSKSVFTGTCHCPDLAFVPHYHSSGIRVWKDILKRAADLGVKEHYGPVVAPKTALHGHRVTLVKTMRCEAVLGGENVDLLLQALEATDGIVARYQRGYSDPRFGPWRHEVSVESIKPVGGDVASSEQVVNGAWEQDPKNTYTFEVEANVTIRSRGNKRGTIVIEANSELEARIQLSQMVAHRTAPLDIVYTEADGEDPIQKPTAFLTETVEAVPQPKPKPKQTIPEALAARMELDV